MKFTMPILALLVAVLLVLSQSLFTVDQRSTRSCSSWARSSRRKPNAGPLLQGAAAAERPLLRQAHPDARHRRAGSLHHLARRSRCWSTPSSSGASSTSSSTTSRCRATRRRRDAAVADGPRHLREEFGKRTMHDAISGERDEIMNVDAAEGRRGRAHDRRRDRRRAAEARRPAAGRHRAGLPAHGVRAQARRQRTALAGRRREREDPRRRRPPARGDPRRRLPRCAEDQGRGRRQGVGDLRARPSATNPEFYAFYRSLEAYRATFRNKSDVMVLDPLRVLQVPRSSAAAGGKRAARGQVARRAAGDRCRNRSSRRSRSCW